MYAKRISTHTAILRRNTETKEEGLTVKETEECFGLSYEKTHDFFKRYNRKQRKIAAGIAIKRPGRPPKDANLPLAKKSG